MSDVALVASELYEEFTGLTYEDAAMVVIGEKDPLPNTEGYLKWCVDEAFRIVLEGR